MCTYSIVFINRLRAHAFVCKYSLEIACLWFVLNTVLSALNRSQHMYLFV